MTLTSRLTAFFLAALAVVLAGFSVTLYLLARGHLYREADDRARAALDALTAVAEVEPGGVEWDARNRTLHRENGPIHWQVRGPDGGIVDQSDGSAEVTPDGEHWAVATRRIDGRVGPPTDPKLHPYLTLYTAIPLDPVHAALEQLALTLVGTSVGVWLVALVGSRWVCRRALRPVTAMAADVKSMSAEDFAGRLPVPPTHDELAALGASFNDLLNRVREAYERQRRFTGDASHQLRTPLAALLGPVEVCLRRPRDAEEYRRVLAAVQVQGQNLRQIVESLLYLARSDADAVLTDLEPIDLRDWLPAHLESYTDHPRSSDVHAEFAGGPAVVRVQPPLLGQLLDNLLENALKYSAPGSPVTVVATAADSGVTLTVEDRGAGIATADLPHVFEPFYRSPAARSDGRPGVGLGLAVARRIAAAFGSTLTATSELGKGSRFAVKFPPVPAAIPALQP